MTNGMLQSAAWHSQGMFMGVHWLWWAFLLFTGVILVWALWRTLSDDRGARRSSASHETAEDALRERFARGDVDEDEYIRRLEVLRNS
jgi:putative membrane protein